MINKISKHNLSGKRVVVTGCGYKPLKQVFFRVDELATHNEIIVGNVKMKLNIGASVAIELAKRGAVVHMVSTSKNKLEVLKEHIDKVVGREGFAEFSAIDLLDEEQVSTFADTLRKDKQIFWVQSVGLGAGTYRIKDGNPYLRVQDIPVNLLEQESKIVLRGTHLLMKKLLPIFKKQNEKTKSITKVAIISSMSAVRSYNLGATHCAAKAAISRYANACMLDLWKDKIYLTDVRPGACDTGAYDNKVVQRAVLEIDKEYGNYYSETQIRLFPPKEAGRAISVIFESRAHIPSVNLVAQGQLPNEGS